MPKFVYDFTEGNKDLKDLLGGKGANLAEMTNLGLPVPPGFTITTEACRYYLAQGAIPDGLDDEVSSHLHALEQAMGRKLGDPADPLLVSVRSGAKFSMPGMMDTVLNIGLSDESVDGLAKQSGNERFAWDAYRRLIQMFGKTVLDIDGEHFEHAIDAAKSAKGVASDTELTAEDLQGAHRDLQGTRPRARRTGVPAGPARADGPRGDGGLQLVELRPRGAVPPPGADPRRPRHGGQHRGDGLRQPGRRLGHRRGVHPRPGHRRPGRVRRLPAERAGRGRRGRASATRCRCRTSSRSTRRPTTSSWRSCGRWRTTTGTCATSSSPSSAASSGCCRPGSASGPPAAAFRIAIQLVEQGMIDLDEALTPGHRRPSSPG